MMVLMNLALLGVLLVCVDGVAEAEAEDVGIEGLEVVLLPVGCQPNILILG